MDLSSDKHYWHGDCDCTRLAVHGVLIGKGGQCYGRVDHQAIPPVRNLLLDLSEGG